MLRSVLRQLQEVQALRDNLRATQARCGELLEETRAQRRRIKELEDELAVVRKVTDFERLKELLKRWQ
jgi:uncharacterized membrane protein